MGETSSGPAARRQNGERRTPVRDGSRGWLARPGGLHLERPPAQRVPARVRAAGGAGAGQGRRRTSGRRPRGAAGGLHGADHGAAPGYPRRGRVRDQPHRWRVSRVQSRTAQDRLRDRRRYRRVSARVRAQTRRGTGRRDVSRALILLLALSPGAGCVYYNAMWSAEQLAKHARQAEERGGSLDARSYWAKAALKAESVVARHPRSRWAEPALVLQGEGLAKSGACDRATSPLETALRAARSEALRERAALALAECALAANAPGAAAPHLVEVTRSRDAGRRSQAALLAGRRRARWRRCCRGAVVRPVDGGCSGAGAGARPAGGGTRAGGGGAAGYAGARQV